MSTTLWALTERDLRRLVLCHPDVARQIHGQAARFQIAGRIDVVASEDIPRHVIAVIDRVKLAQALASATLTSSNSRRTQEET
jgi:CRP-like cAMP-binding protein